uniref:Gustatory receptor n=1 Tax=Strigamia maritima TaxID=126957 RepID=T1JK97_STRMM
MESKDDNATRKINRLWRYLYAYVGFFLSKNNYCFAIFITLFTLANLTEMICNAISTFHDTSISIAKVCIFLCLLAYYIESFLCMLLIRKRQCKFLLYLNILQGRNIDAVLRNRAWIILLILVTSAIITLLVCLALEICFYMNFHDIPSILQDLLIISNWFTAVVANEMSKILFIYFCILISFNFECLMTQVKNTTALLYSSRKQKKMLKHDYDHQFYTITQQLDDINNLFEPLLPIWIAGDIVYICISLRVLTNSAGDFYSFIVFTLRLLVVLLVMYFYAARVNEKARAMAIAITKLMMQLQQNGTLVTQQINSLSASQTSVEQWKHQMFIQHLSLATTGIDVSGYFIITKGSILTLLGTLFTYAVVLFQTT